MCFLCFFLSGFALSLVTFDSLFPLLACFSGEGHGVFKSDDFDLLDSAPDDEPSVTNRFVDIDSVYGAPVKHGDEPFILVAGSDGGDSPGCSLAKRESCPVGSIFGDEVLK